VISNPNNPTIRSVGKLRKRRERDRRGAILVEGHRALAAALTAGARVEQVIHTRTATARRGELLGEAKQRGAALFEVTPAVMAALTSVETAPDVLAVSIRRPASLVEAARAFGLGAVLAGVRDPATAGSVLSSCAAAGGSVAIATTGTTDIFAPKCIRSGAGAHFVLRVVADVDPAECVRMLRGEGVRLIAIDPDGADLASTNLSGPVAVVVGDDGALSDEMADVWVGVGAGGPVRPTLAVEAAVVLFEAWRRRSRPGEAE
jgi:TrmH family RNA methyltransferase